MKESKFNMKIKNSMRYHGIRTLDDQPGNFATPKKYNRSRSPLPQTITYTQNCFDYLNICPNVSTKIVSFLTEKRQILNSSPAHSPADEGKGPI